MTRFAGTKLLAFVAVCLALTVYLAFTIGNIRPSHLWFLHRDYSLSANFDDVTGLNTGDSVKVAGVIVGKVSSVKVVDGPNNGTGRAQVRFSVHKTIRLPKNTEASIRWRNLLGQRYLYLTPPDAAHAAPTVLRSGDRITNTISVVDIGELFNRLGPIINVLDPGQINQFVDAVSGALSGNEQNLTQALDNLANVTASLATHDDAIGRLVGNVNTVAATVSNRDQEIKTVLDNLVAISSTFSGNTKIVDDAITNLGTVSTNLDRLLSANRAQIDRILTNLNTVLNVVVGRLPTINAVLSGFPNASRSLLALGNVGQFLALTAPCLSVQLLPGADAAIPCNTPLNNPGPAGAASQAAAAAAAAANPNAATAANPNAGANPNASANANANASNPAASTAPGQGIYDFLGALAGAGSSPAAGGGG
ncbi:MAG: phospholipid/cholesterol/gamma-HCH transport system substrate-binding protein [Acidimicrobiaceae bacterium]|nr:phospholipid/cholesterol/gamma-HCH transport system substrate-binding protein [Acidimicrobiaceae bacterium]